MQFSMALILPYIPNTDITSLRQQFATIPYELQNIHGDYYPSNEKQIFKTLE